ncbi:MAG: HlyC/CorC family transporter [Calditrichia bacterium]|nr:HlyC/CorC family transporter [Calditrichia bacterium]
MELIIAIIGLIFSFFFAGSETAFISTNPLRIEIWTRKKLRSAIRAQKYFKNPDIFLSTTLVGNNLANVLATTYATIFLITYWDETLSWIVITLTILLFGEIIPKVLFRTYAHSLILKIVDIMRFFHFLLNPLIILATRISLSVIRLFRLGSKSEKTMFDKDDIVAMLREARLSGVVDEEEQKIISRVLNLPDTLVREAMVPRTSIQAISEKSKISDIRNFMIETGKTKIPVYKSTIDNITGIIFIYDLFADNTRLIEVIKPVTYVPENKKCNELLHEFKEMNTSIAIVIDEYGGTAGLVTIEDLVEELLGEIEESTENSEQPIIRINKTTWKIRASESIEIINEQIGVNIPEGEYETLAGFILAELGRIPETGEKIALNDSLIMITRASRNIIEEVRLVKIES